MEATIHMISCVMKIMRINFCIYISNLLRLERALNEFIIILVSWPVYVTNPNTYLTFLKLQPLSKKLLKLTADTLFDAVVVSPINLYK